MISGNMVGSYSQIGKTFTLVDESGNEIVGVIVDQETKFTAHDNDVREGMVYASDCGVSTGTKDIPGYETSAGIELISPGSSFCIPLSQKNRYDYTVFQCMVALADFNDMNNSINTSMVSLNGSVFEVNSTNKVSDVLKNVDTQSIDLNMTNNTDNYYIIHYFTYKEV